MQRLTALKRRAFIQRISQSPSLYFSGYFFPRANEHKVARTDFLETVKAKDIDSVRREAKRDARLVHLQQESKKTHDRLILQAMREIEEEDAKKEGRAPRSDWWGAVQKPKFDKQQKRRVFNNKSKRKKK